MPTNDFTAKLLEMEDAIIEDLSSSNTEMHVYFSLKRRPHACPHCNTVTDKVHDYRTSIIKDIPWSGKLLFLHYKKRRYHCPCCGKHFYEMFALVPKQHRITLRASFYALHLLKNHYSIRSAGNLTGLSASSIFRRLKDISFPKPSHLPKVLSIDEFRGNAGGEKFQGILTDPAKHELLDILPDRSQTTLVNYFSTFSNRKNVQYFVMDMNQTYRDLVHTYFPNAKIVIDRFHVVRYVTWAMENVRKRIQKDFVKEKRRYFKRSRKLLLTHQEKLSPENLEAVSLMLQQSPDLATAYRLKELFYDFMAAPDRTTAAKKLHFFILSAQASQLDEFKPCLTMLGNWSNYILNAFDCPYSNGYTEGTNNAIKVIKRNAFGYRNFSNFRNRIFLALT